MDLQKMLVGAIIGIIIFGINHVYFDGHWIGIIAAVAVALFIVNSGIQEETNKYRDWIYAYADVGDRLLAKYGLPQPNVMQFSNVEFIPNSSADKGVIVYYDTSLNEKRYVGLDLSMDYKIHRQTPYLGSLIGPYTNEYALKKLCPTKKTMKMEQALSSLSETFGVEQGDITSLLTQKKTGGQQADDHEYY